LEGFLSTLREADGPAAAGTAGGVAVAPGALGADGERDLMYAVSWSRPSSEMSPWKVGMIGG
jgi:hypothetical protein